MVRVKRGPMSKNRRLRILTFSKGLRGVRRIFRKAPTSKAIKKLLKLIAKRVEKADLVFTNYYWTRSKKRAKSNLR